MTEQNSQRLNKFLASYTDLSRRKADTVIASGHVRINGKVAKIGDVVLDGDEVIYNDKQVHAIIAKPIVVLLNKPVGFVCSRDGQGSRSIYSLLPSQFQHLNIAGRLDKDSSGLVVFTNDGDILNRLTHPSNNKQKIYQVKLDRALADAHTQAIRKGVNIGDERPSRFAIKSLRGIDRSYEVAMDEGRNRQIRRTFEALGYEVVNLHRISVGSYKLGGLLSKKHTIV